MTGKVLKFPTPKKEETPRGKWFELVAVFIASVMGATILLIIAALSFG